MVDYPWVSIIGLNEYGPNGLPSASLAALREAEIVMGPPRHLSLLPDLDSQRVEWPVPFADGVPKLLGFRGHRVAVLASGDPFWFGLGTVLARHLKPQEWRGLPGPSCFSLVVNHLGWALEKTLCFGLHAAPLARLRPHLSPGARMIILVQDGAAVTSLAEYLCREGFGASELTVFESLGSPNARVTKTRSDAVPDIEFCHPVCAALEIAGAGTVLPLATGRPDDWFESDGQITKRQVRALTLSALAPRPGEYLWDIGGGSGSIGIEWLLAHQSLGATTIEPRSDRARRIRSNANRLGVDRLTVVTGIAPRVLAGLTSPDAVFVGGGLNRELLDWFKSNLSEGTRIVANAVTLETEALLLETANRLGGDLSRIALSQPAPLGTFHAWKTAFPILQWSVTL